MNPEGTPGVNQYEAMDTLRLLRAWNRIQTKRERMQFEDRRTYEVSGIEEAWKADSESLEQIRKVLETRGAKFLPNGDFELEGSSSEIQKIVRENGPEE
jgi:hypothetical protein